MEEMWQSSNDPEIIKKCKDYYKRTGIPVIKNEDILDKFSYLLWTRYNASAIGKTVVIRNWNTVKDYRPHIEHEAIHTKQWGLEKWIIGWLDLAKINKKYWDLVPWAIDFATDNQITERETYLNQLEKNSALDINPRKYLKYFNKKNKINKVNKYFQKEINKQEEIIKKLKEQWNDFYKEEEKLKQMNKYLLQNTEDYHQFITFWESDWYKYKKTWPERQINFQTEESLRKQLAIDYFITQYPTKWQNYTEDSFKQGTELYNRYHKLILPIMNEFSKNGNKKNLKLKMKKIFEKVHQETGIKNKDWK